MKYKRGKNITSHEIIKYDDHYIELLENYECKDKSELRRREGELQREHKDNIVNSRIECRNKKEWCLNNKEKIKAYHKKYQIDNKEKIKKNRKQYQIDNKEKLKQYRIDNKEKIDERNKKYYLHNKEKLNEKHKQYKIDNKEKRKAYDKQYTIDNKEKINEKHKCICGSEYTKRCKTKHEKTKKHINYITNLKQTDKQTHQE
jgi:hypothetical protein